MMNMSSIKESLKTAREKYREAKELCKDTKNDRSPEPFKCKYQAAEILRDLQSELSEWRSDDSAESPCLSIISALLNYELGVIAYETEELANCEKYLQESWEDIKDDSTTPESVNLAISVLNHLGILWSGRSEPKKACDYLKQAEMLYAEYKLSQKPCPCCLEDLFLMLEEPKAENTDWAPFEKALTNTLYYLAQVYEHINENELSAKYCHMTLKRQIDSNEYDPLDCGINCATLSQYFIAKDKFVDARHVLACASHIILEYKEQLEKNEAENKEQLEKNEAENKENEKWDHYHRAVADIARCWSKYALHLLIVSYEKNLKSVKSGSAVVHQNGSSEDSRVCKLLKENKVKEFEDQIVCCLISDFEEARPVFLSALHWLNEAKKYYILNDYTYDHVQILQDNSKLYKFLASFEKDIDRQCKMHKRRVDILETILKRINPQFYLALCRQLTFELAETYSEMMDLKIKAANAEDTYTSHAVSKINFLANKSIENYGSFIDSLKNSKKEIPDKLTDDVVRPALVAHFCIGRLYSKLISTDTDKQVEFLNKGEEHYKFVINYVERNPEHEKTVEKELPVIKEMVKLLPAKIQAVLGRTVF